MATGTPIAETQAAIEALLKSRVPAGVIVRGLTGADFEEETALLVVTPPAALVMFRDEGLDSKEAYGLIYDSTQGFSVIAGAVNLRGDNEERIGALELLNRVCDALAGARLGLAGTTQKPLVVLRRVYLGQFDAEGTWYVLEAEVVSVAQFSGNA